jgi:hypothetical protein
MVAHIPTPSNPVPSPGGRPRALTAGVELHVTRWFLERKLSRRTRADFASMVLRVFAIRIYAAAACFVSMLLVAWVGAFARAFSAHDWHAFRTLDSTTLTTASAQASRFQGSLLPVLLAWAVLLLLTPTGYTLAFRAAAAAAGILGYLHFTPPSFLVTAKVATASHWLSSFDVRYEAVFLFPSIVLAYVLQSSAVSIFRHLDQLRRKPGRASGSESPSAELVRRLCAIPLALLVLLAVTWAATVVRLAASSARVPATGMSYGFQGGLYQGKYLLVLVLIAICMPLIANSEKWLTAAVILTACYGLAPDTLAFPSVLEVSAGPGVLTRIGTVWGSDSLWAALFIFIPAAILGIYFVGRLLRSL